MSAPSPSPSESQAKPTLLPLPVPWPENVEVKLYTGGCHCKRFRYEFSHPDLYAMPVLSCNCSICEDRGALNVFTYDHNFRFTSGSGDEMTKYTFGTGVIFHRFCPVCGTSIGPALPSQGFVVVNTRTVDGIELARLQLRSENGKEWAGPGSDHPEGTA